MTSIPTTPAPFSPAASSLSSPLDDDSTTLALLQQQTQNDEEFAHLLRERTKQRKEREDAALAHLRVQVRQLESALAAETKRRVHAIAEVKTEAQVAVKSVTDQWKQSLEKEGTVVNQRLAVLEDRIAALENRWRTDVANVEKAVSTKAVTWKSTLDEIQAQAASERKARLQREGRLMQRIEELSTTYEDQWKEARHDRVSALDSLTQRVQVQEGAREAQVRGLEEKIQKSLEELDLAVKQEVRERQAHDEVIVTALNKYTAQVQTSLSFVSGV